MKKNISSEIYRVIDKLTYHDQLNYLILYHQTSVSGIVCWGEISKLLKEFDRKTYVSRVNKAAGDIIVFETPKQCYFLPHFIKFNYTKLNLNSPSQKRVWKDLQQIPTFLYDVEVVEQKTTKTNNIVYFNKISKYKVDCIYTDDMRKALLSLYPSVNHAEEMNKIKAWAINKPGEWKKRSSRKFNWFTFMKKWFEKSVKAKPKPQYNPDGFIN